MNKSENILRGVPKAHYGAFDGVTPFPICLKAVSDYLGVPLDYAFAIVACGAAFRLVWDTTDWNGGNVDVRLAYADGARVFRNGVEALGREFRILWAKQRDAAGGAAATKADFEAFIKAQIDGGHPVISLGPVGPPEAGILTGYRDGGDTLLGWSVFQQWMPVATDEEGYFVTDTWWEPEKDCEFLGVISLGKIIAPRHDTKQILANAIAALEGRQEGEFAKGIAAYDAWKHALLGAEENDFAIIPGWGQSKAMMCHADAVDCLADGRGQAVKYFRRLAGEHPARPLYAAVAEQFAIIAERTICENSYPLLGGHDRNEVANENLRNPEIRRRLAAHIDEMKAADTQALALMKQLLAAEIAQ